jgi:hypothetical protein
LLVSAYKNTNNQVVTVIINQNTEPAQISLNTGATAKASKTKMYQTSATEDLLPVSQLNGTPEITVAAKSILTIVSDML